MRKCSVGMRWLLAGVCVLLGGASIGQAEILEVGLDVVNPSFEDKAALGDGRGGLLGWDVAGGSSAIQVVQSQFYPAPTSGAYDGRFFLDAAGTSGLGREYVSQVLDVSDWFFATDKGDVSVTLAGWGYAEPSDYVRLEVEFFDGSETPVSLGILQGDTVRTSNVWSPLLLQATLPEGTRSLDFRIELGRTAGSITNAGADGFQATLTIVPEPASVVLLGVGGTVLLLLRRRK